MRIAYVVSRFPDPSETFVLRELNAVARREGVEVELYVLFAPKNPFVHPEARRWIGRAHRTSWRAAAIAPLSWLIRRPRATAAALAGVIAGYWRRPRRLARALVAFTAASAHARTMKAAGIEHVHAHFATYPALAAWTIGRLIGVPYTFTAHAHDIYIDQLNLRTLVREAKAVAAISEYNRALLSRYGAGGETPVEVVHCGVDPAAYAFRPRSLPREGPVNAICVATLNELKGHRVLFEALAADDEQLRRISVDLIGSGPLEAPLRAQVAALGLERRVRFHGTRSEEEVAQMLAAADAFVLPSVIAANGQMDGIPVALMEALAAGVPVLASRLSGIPELVRDGVTGLLAEPGDAGDLARALRDLLSDPDGALARARAGRLLIEQEFDVERSAEAMIALFAGA